LVNLRVTAIGLLPKLEPQPASAAAANLEAALAGVRLVYFEELGGFVETPCYARSQLAPGMSFEGPAIVDQDDATTVIFPHFHAHIDPVGNLILGHRTA
jgi:N-methylhydantoinase A/oxoprolinase/acetone carboxylase beta subunit